MFWSGTVGGAGVVRRSLRSATVKDMDGGVKEGVAITGGLLDWSGIEKSVFRRSSLP